MPSFHDLAIQESGSFIYGSCPSPVILKNGMSIGGGLVFPELNFTLPGMIVDASTMSEVRKEYTQMITEASKRAVELNAPGLVVEFELLPDLTLTPEWGAEITKILKDTLNDVQEKSGMKTALRVTPNDIREFARPPIQRSGKFVGKMYRSFELCAEAGADFFSIESTGGKEIHDDAILNGDLELSVFGLAILGSRDMTYLWRNIVDISNRYGVIPAGDSACGFGNTAMVLAEQHFIPRVWAALIRVMTVPRSLIAFEQGAIGPNKDCAYEGPYIKAITGCPISLEGAEAAVAHLSPIGNIAKAVPDLWSNESVNNIKLLGGMAPTVSVEQLIYATRLMNAASSHGIGAALDLRNWSVESDAKLDPQAYVLKPNIVLEIAKDIIGEPTAYLRTRKAAQVTLLKLQEADNKGELSFSKHEKRWLDNLSRKADRLPGDENEFIQSVLPNIDRSKVRLSEYEIKDNI
jgi:methanol--5-hydroxybenzimidazolylcobamide Co-methyltransferase